LQHLAQHPGPGLFAAGVATVAAPAAFAATRPLWEEIALHYQAGVDGVRGWRKEWATIAGRIDHERHTHVGQLLRRQEMDAAFWRDGCLRYFQVFAKRPLPAGVEPATQPLEYFVNFRLEYVPGDPAMAK
jgi:alpha-glucuronidase